MKKSNFFVYFSVGAPVLSHGESMISLLKLLSTLRNRYPFEIRNGKYPLFKDDEFWFLYSNAMKELVIHSPDSPAIEFEKNQELAKYVLK